MKKILLFLLLTSTLSFAQGVLYSDSVHSTAWVYGQKVMTALPGAKITVCGSPAIGVPCTNTIAVYSDSAMTHQIANPVTADDNSNFIFYAVRALLQYTVTTSTGQSFGPYSLSPPWSVVSASSYSDANAAIAALGGNGGAVLFEPGNYPGPSNVPANTSLKCSTWLGCTFTYTSNVTFGSPTAEIDKISIDGFIFDFGGNNAGLTLRNVNYSRFAMRIQDTGTANGLTLLSDSPYSNVSWNDFPYLHLLRSYGMLVDGSSNMSACNAGQDKANGAVYGNHFGFAFLENMTGPLDWKGGDSTSFDYLFIRLSTPTPGSTQPGMIISSRCPYNQFGDVDLLHFGHFTIECTGAGCVTPDNHPLYIGPMIVANFGRATFDTLVTGVGMTASNIMVSHPPYSGLQIGWQGNSPYSALLGGNWSSLQVSSLVSTGETVVDTVGPNAPGLVFSRDGVLKWKQFLAADDSLYWYNGTENVVTLSHTTGQLAAPIITSTAAMQAQSNGVADFYPLTIGASANGGGILYKISDVPHYATFIDPSNYFHIVRTDSAGASTGDEVLFLPDGTIQPKGYRSADGTAGYTGTKTAGSCTMTIKNGIITNVTGC